MRVAFYSPLPPERSGIADYSYELLEELRHHVDIVAVVAEKQLGVVRAPEGVELVGSDAANDLVVDCNLYQMGNNSKYHRFFYSRAFEEPGLLVMHDPSLADFTAEMCGGAEGAIFRDEVAYDCPDIGPKDDLPLVDVGNGRRDLDRLRVLLARRIVASNVRTLVHSSAMAHEMGRRYPEGDIATIQLPAPVLDADTPKNRGAKGLVFGVFGGINYYKRILPIVEAFAEVRARHPDSRMVVAGRADDHLLERELRSIAASPRLRGALEVKTDLSLEDLEHEMRRCDVGISLRWPTAGEMSATLMRTLGAGRPAIVSDVLQFRELDDRYCWRVTTDFDREHASLVDVMDRAAADPAMCRRAGERAREFVAREATYRVVAEQYVGHLEHCSERRNAFRAAYPDRGIRSSRPLGVNIIAPSEPGEIAEAARRTTDALRLAGVDVVVVELAAASLRPRTDELDREIVVLDSESATSVDADGRRNGRGDRRHLRNETAAARVEQAIRALDPVDRGAQAVGPHLVDFYFVAPNESDRYGRLAKVRRARGRRIVGILSPQYVPLPRALGGFLAIADHLIAPSEFAEEVARLSTIVDVTGVPWPTKVDPSTSIPTPTLDGADCTFLAIARAGTPIAQTNPFATVAAFRSAFTAPERGKRAQLVVVLEDHERRPEARGALQPALDAIGGKLVVDPPADELERIIAATDVYVSLHRAEGFGLHLVDMMARGKAVIATGWSGNLDFMDRSNSCLVGYDVRDLDPGDLYLDPQEQIEPARSRFWVDPDTGGAARWMQLLESDVALRARLGRAAADRVRVQFAPEIVGIAARECLAKVADGPARVEPPRLRPAEWASHLRAASDH